MREKNLSPEQQEETRKLLARRTLQPRD
jgi:hypothetical protein